MEIIINNQKFNVDNANSFFKRFLGFMGKKNINRGLFFPHTGSIHTFFMKTPIDVLMIDKNMKVVLIKKELKKNQFLFHIKAKYTLELPPKSISNIHINDMVIIKK